MKKLLLAILLTVVPVSNLSAKLISQTRVPASDTSELISPKTGVNYAQLQDMLSQEQWRRANYKTRELLLQAAGRKAAGWADVASIEKLSCWDIAKVERLWQDYSNGRFGLASQFPVYISTGNRPGITNQEAYERFGDTVGWREEGRWKGIQNFTYNLSAPSGHLPSPYFSTFSIYGNDLVVTTYFKRAADCGVVNQSSSLDIVN